MANILSIAIIWLILNRLQSTMTVNIQIFETYQRYIGKLKVNHAVGNMIIFALPLCIFSLILNLIKPIGLLYFTVSTIVLLYACLYRPDAEVLSASPKGQEADIYIMPLSRTFPVLFWFLVSGALGVLLYDFIRRAGASWIKNIAEFPTSRLLGMGYALAGHFMPVFSYSLKHFFPATFIHINTKNNTTYLENCGFLALHGKLADELTEQDIDLTSASALVKRAYIMLFIVALLTAL